MKNIKNILALLVIVLMGLSLTACSNDDLDTNQYKEGVNLNAFGPNPVLRGGTLRFVGSNLDQIASIQIPGISAITNYEVVRAGIPSEIRITVPKDGPEVGVIILTTKTNQTITTQRELTYTENIEFEGFSPASVMPGDVVTITGDYLNLIHSLAFAENVVVGEENFLSHDRYSITVAVPENAQTGKIELYTLDLTAATEDALDYQILTSENALEIGVPSISKISGRNEASALGNINAKAGEKITITGTYFNIAEAVKVGGYLVEDITVSNDGKTLTFTLPAEAPGGDVLIVCKSGVEVPVGTLTTVKPSNLKSAPAPVKAGMVLTVTGMDLDLVTGVQFPLSDGSMVDGGEFTAAADKVTITSVPETAVEGDIQLLMANGESVTVGYTLVKPTVTGYDHSSVSAGGTLTIKGTNLDLVKKVQFGDGSDVVNVEGSDNTITLTVPMNAVSGSPILTLANGTTVENVPSVNVEEAVFCYITEKIWENEGVELKAGNSMTVIVANGDKLTGVEMNGETCQWILTGEDKNQLIIGIPESAKAKSTLKLLSSNGEITYDVPVIPATSVNKVVWTGLTQISWNDGGRVLIPASAFEGAPEGAIMTLCYSQVENQWDQAQVNYGNWSGINFNQAGEGVVTFSQTLVPTDIYGWFSDGILDRETSVILTKEILDNIQALKGGAEGGEGYGIIIQGSGLTFSKVTLSWEISLETDLATLIKNMDGSAISYPYTMTWGDNGRFNLSQDLLLNEIGVKKGSKLMFYKNTSNTGQIQINNSSWSAIYYLTDWNATEEVLVQEFDDTLMDAVNNGGLVIQGDLGGITKITILP
ncbi:MAG: IPT/TIG domain-containing protein [Prevotella sp.]|nr:IPT/TIG domain-containing protein [Prevotella sp.]MBQ9223028.1 IPT/TIG domain-containing protein [Prevotella sp.]